MRGLYQRMTQDKLHKYLFLIFLSFFLCSCASSSKSLINNVESEKDKFIKVVINNAHIKEKSDASDFINDIREVFTNGFQKVEVVTGYISPQTGDLLIEPLSIGASAWLAGGEATATATARVKLSILNYTKTIDIAGDGCVETSAAEVIIGLPAMFATLGISTMATVAVQKSMAKDKAIESAAIDLYNRIHSDDEFIQFADTVKLQGTEPAVLSIILKYSDLSSLIPNNTINGGESSLIIATITNDGKGSAFDVKLTTESANENISFPSSIKIGDIDPSETKEVEIPLSANLALSSGTVTFLINAREKRGYDPRPLELQIPTARFQKPELSIASYSLNDSSGLASGNGDGIPGNNEIIELNTFIKNNGEGDALQVNVKLTGISEGIEIIKGEDVLTSVGTNAVSKASLAFKIPRTYAKPDIRYTITVADIRGMTTEKSYTISFTAKAPVLACTYQVFDNNNREAPGLENGKSYLLKLTPRNTGSNLAEGVKVRLNAQTSKVDIGRFDSHIGRLRAGNQGATVTIPFSLDRSYDEPSLDFNLSITQDSFSGLSRKITLPVLVRRPKLSYQAVLLNGMGKKAVSQNSHPNFRISISNNGSLDAADVTVRFKVDRGDIAFDKTEKIGTIRAGESQYRDFTFFVRGDARVGDLPIDVSIRQDDFDDLQKMAAFDIIKQSALVQKVEASENVIAGFRKASYSGPPEVYVNSPNNNIEVFKETIDLHGSIITFGAGNDVEDVSVTINGKELKVTPVPEDMRLGTNRIARRQVEANKILLDGEVALAPELNEIKIVCIDRNNQKSEHVIHVTKKAKLGNIYAVVVGISNFAYPSYKLQYAASDAKKFYNFLRSEKGGGLSADRVKLLTDAEATRAGIIAAMTKFLGKATKDDTVQIYFATHGLVGEDGNLYYLAYNTDIGNLRGTGFSNNDLEDIVNTNIHAGKIVMYIDSCHSGLSGLSKKLYAKRGIGVYEVNEKINSLAAQLSKTATGVTTFSASSASGFSLEDSEWDGGIFTYCLLNGLNGEANEDKDEWVTIGELENYLNREVLVLTEGKQKPKVNGTLLDETPLSKVR